MSEYVWATVREEGEPHLFAYPSRENPLNSVRPAFEKWTAIGWEIVSITIQPQIRIGETSHYFHCIAVLRIPKPELVNINEQPKVPE